MYLLSIWRGTLILMWAHLIRLTAGICLIIWTWELLPPFMWQPPPPPPREWKCWSDNLSVLLVYLATWAEDSQQYLRASIFDLWDFSNCSEKQPSGLLFLVLGWHSLFVNKCSRTLHHNYFHHLSSLHVIIFEEYIHLLNPGVKVSYLAFLPWCCRVLMDIWLDIPSLVCINFS